MFAAKLLRRGLAVGSALLVTGALGVVGLAQPAAATSAVLYGRVECSNSNHYGNVSTWYPSNVMIRAGSSSITPGLVSVPGTYAFQFAQTLPAGSTSVGIQALCSSGHSPYGDFTGTVTYTTIPAGTTSITASWRCSTAPVNPGPWITDCTLQSASFS
ncbi:hypothetical protein [Streptosporangium sp. NPDC006930]|uniref:hypothetical protein n=1 Tax=unclassified Streptosporangium TaxID=2632669 RepID=UPI003435F7C4